jgi:very-short-patch-repair endonuclease
MNPPLPPEREGSTRRRRAGEGLSLQHQTKDHAYDPLPTQRSRALRTNATPVERKLWSVLRNSQLCGVRFNRQVVIRPYICDFVARSLKLVVEVDGGQHGASIAYDQRRTAFLKAKGYRVLRFWNNDIINNLEGVVLAISEALQSPPPARAGGVESAELTGGGPVVPMENRPSPSRLRRSSPPALAGGEEEE